MWCFAQFDLQMRFLPQRHAIFPDRNFQNGSAPGVLCAFWLRNVLFATAACHFSRSELSKWLCAWGVFCTFWSRDALRTTAACIFPDRNFQNGSANVVFCAFWRRNALRATAACHFSSLCWRATSARAALASLLFEHQEPRIIAKTQRFASFLTFCACIFFLVTVLACWSSFYWLRWRVDLLSTDLTTLRLCFWTVHIVGS